MAQPCGPFCCHPQCWRNTNLAEKDSNRSEASKKPVHLLSANCPTLSVQTLTKELETGPSVTTVENRLPQRHRRLLRIAEERTPEPTESIFPEPPHFSFAEMQLCFENSDSDFGNQFYQWIDKPSKFGRRDDRDLYAEIFGHQNKKVVHTVNILQQLLPSRRQTRSGLAPPRASIKAREYFGPTVASITNRERDGRESPASEALLNLIASSKNAIASPRETPLPAEVAYKKYASTMLPKITRSESLQTIIQRETSSPTESTSSSQKTQRMKTRANGIPLTTLTLRLEGDNISQIAAITDRRAIVSSERQKNMITEEKSATARTGSTVSRMFSGISLKARQGSVKSSTASTAKRKQQQKPPTAPVIEDPDPLGYLSSRQRFPDDASNLSYRGTHTERTLTPASALDSIADAKEIVPETPDEKVPPVEEILKLPSNEETPEFLSAANTAKAPPVSPIHDDGVVTRGSTVVIDQRPSSPPWLGLYVYESADSLNSSRVPSVTKRCSPTSALSNAPSLVPINNQLTVIPFPVIYNYNNYDDSDEDDAY